MKRSAEYGPYPDQDVFTQKHAEIRLDMEDLLLYWRGEPNRAAGLGHTSTDDRIIMFRGVVNAPTRLLSDDFIERLKEEGASFGGNKVRVIIEGHYWSFHFRAESKDLLLIYSRAEVINQEIYNQPRSYRIISMSRRTFDSSRIALERHELIRGVKSVCKASMKDKLRRTVQWLLHELHACDSFQLQSFPKTEMLLARHAVHMNKWLQKGNKRSHYPDRKLFSEWTRSKARTIRRKTEEQDIPYILPSIEAWMESHKWFELLKHVSDRGARGSDPSTLNEQERPRSTSPMEAQTDSDDEEVHSESSELGFERSRASSPELGGPVEAHKSRALAVRESSSGMGDVGAAALPSSPESNIARQSLRRSIRPRLRGRSRRTSIESSRAQSPSGFASERSPSIDSEMEVDATVEPASGPDDMESYLTSLRRSPQYQIACRERLPKNIWNWKSKTVQPNTFRLRWVCPLPSLEFPQLRQCDCLFEVNFHKDEFLPEFKELLSAKSRRYLHSAMEDPSFNELLFFFEHGHNPYQPALADIVRAHNYWHYWQYRVGAFGGADLCADDGPELLIKLENATFSEVVHVKQRLDRRAMLYKYEPGTVINLADMLHEMFWNVEIPPVRPGSDAP